MEKPEEPISMRTLALYFGGVGAIAIFALVRAMMRRKFSDTGCGPIG